MRKDERRIWTLTNDEILMTGESLPIDRSVDARTFSILKSTEER
jgi:hypothetical protein